MICNNLKHKKTMKFFLLVNWLAYLYQQQLTVFFVVCLSEQRRSNIQLIDNLIHKQCFVHLCIYERFWIELN
jgi:hypothetical protein